jgi:hypothetical protein
MVYEQAMNLVVFAIFRVDSSEWQVTDGGLTSIATGLKYPKFPAVWVPPPVCGIAVPEL